MLLLALLLYGSLVLNKLSSIQTGFVMSMFMSLGQNWGVGGGFIACCAACGLQLTQLALYPFVQREYAEDDYIDAKLMKDEEHAYGTMMPPGQFAAGGGFGIQTNVTQPAGMVLVGGHMPMTGMTLVGMTLEQTTIVTTSGGSPMTYNPGPSAPREMGYGAAF